MFLRHLNASSCVMIAYILNSRIKKNTLKNCAFIKGKELIQVMLACITRGSSNRSFLICF